jgi:transcriptional regulator with XRE-family HTH domain
MELESTLISIGAAVREERSRAGWTLEQLAGQAEMSMAHLSRIESGDRQPSIASLISLARALGVSVSVLLGEGRGGPAIASFDQSEPSHEANGLTITSCSGYPGSSTLNALRITIDPARQAPVPARHRGEEWVYVISGTLHLAYDDESYVIAAGGTVHFDASRPHLLLSQAGPTEVLVVAADTPVDLRSHPLFTASISQH